MEKMLIVYKAYFSANVRKQKQEHLKEARLGANKIE